MGGHVFLSRPFFVCLVCVFSLMCMFFLSRSVFCPAAVLLSQDKKKRNGTNKTQNGTKKAEVSGQHKRGVIGDKKTRLGQNQIRLIFLKKIGDKKTSKCHRRTNQNSPCFFAKMSPQKKTRLLFAFGGFNGLSQGLSLEIATQFSL